jgi:serine/threonine protein kinase
MRTIHLRSSLSTGIEPAVESCNELLIEDAPLGGGGFGDVYRCSKVDNRIVTPLVVKIFLQGNADVARQCMATISILQQKLRDEHLKRVQAGSSLLAEYPALAGVPLLSFTGMLDGKAVTGCVARDLEAAGMEELADVQEKDDCHKRYQSIPFEGRLAMASQLLSALEFLSLKASYLHCDLKAAALFFRAKPAQCALIDFDGGTVLRDPNDEPSTFGTLEGWIAPEVLRQVTAAKLGRSVKVSLASEQWSAACAVHFILFGCTPDFFLSEMSDRAVRAYLARYTWPEINPTFPYCRKGIGLIHARYLKWVVQRLTAELRRYFNFTFSKGYFDPAQRTTFSQWIMALEAAQWPAIHSFKADPAWVKDKRPVRLSWETSGAKRIELRGIGDVTGRDSCELTVRKTSVFELVLTPKTGSPIIKSLRVEVDDRPPVIRFFNTDKPFLPDSRPARLSWGVDSAVRVEITPGIGDVTGRNFIEVAPRRDTTYILRAISGLDIEAIATAQVKVSRQAPAVLTFKASARIAFANEEVELNWKTSGAEVVSISPGIGIVGLEGNRKTRVTATTKFVLTAKSYFGVVSISTISVYVTKLTALNSALTAQTAKRTTLCPLTTLLTSSALLKRDILGGSISRTTDRGTRLAKGAAK